MGRPLNKRHFGNPANDGNQLEVEAWIPGGSGMVTAWVVAQKSNTTYIVTDGTDTGRCRLQSDAITGAGQMRIVVSPFGGGTEYTKILNTHIVKTYEGNMYRWYRNRAAAAAGEADLDFS
jgi:hypothetical protein